MTGGLHAARSSSVAAWVMAGLLALLWPAPPAAGQGAGGTGSASDSLPAARSVAGTSMASAPPRRPLPATDFVHPSTTVDTPPPAVSPDSAARIRAALERPPGDPPFEAVDVVALPFRVATFPLVLLGEGLGFVLDVATRPGPAPFYMVAYRDMVEWGVRPGVTSIGPRSGTALQVDFDRYEPFFVRTAVSVRGSQEHRAGFRWGDASRGLEVSGGFHRDAEPRFWGLGADSREADQTSFRHDRVHGRAFGHLQAASWLLLRAEAGYEENRVEDGFDDNSLPLDELFPPETLFGFGEETRFVRTGLSAVLDFTRRTGFQRRGLSLTLGGDLYRGLGSTRADFHRWRGSAEGYLPLNGLQSLALWVGVESNRGDSGPGVPFTHLATLGDGPGGRGYPEGRFRSRDLAAAAAEWRYEVWRELQERFRLEAFLFFEEGTAVRDLTTLSSSDLRPSYGVGLRLVDREGLVGRAYVADGDESPRFQLDLTAEF